MEQWLYQRKTHDIDELKQQHTATWANLEQLTIVSAIDQWCKRQLKRQKSPPLPTPYYLITLLGVSCFKFLSYPYLSKNPSVSEDLVILARVILTQYQCLTETQTSQQ